MREGAGGGEREGLAGINLTGIAESRVGGGNARPCRAVAVVREGERPERVAGMDGHFRLRAGGRQRSRLRDDEDGPRLNALAIKQSWIRGKPILPAGACAEKAAGESPERVARLNGDA